MTFSQLDAGFFLTIPPAQAGAEVVVVGDAVSLIDGLVCASCGHANSEGAKFCEECGPFAAVPAGATEQRKTVTVLFCDLTGSTTLGETIDPERLRAELARYFERMKAILERHGGSVEKFIGDAVMAVFGVPVLHEDDALRALRAAAEMRDALPELGLARCGSASRARSSPAPRSGSLPATRSTSLPGWSRRPSRARC